MGAFVIVKVEVVGVSDICWYAGVCRSLKPKVVSPLKKNGAVWLSGEVARGWPSLCSLLYSFLTCDVYCVPNVIYPKNG